MRLCFRKGSFILFSRRMSQLYILENLAAVSFVQKGRSVDAVCLENSPVENLGSPKATLTKFIREHFTCFLTVPTVFCI